MAKTFPFATVQITNVKNGGQKIVRRHTSLVQAKRFAQGANMVARSGSTGAEYGILVRPTKADFDIEGTNAPVASSRTNGKKRFGVFSVTLSGGNITGVAKLHTSIDNALDYADDHNGGSVEYGIVLRTDGANGDFPSVED